GTVMVAAGYAVVQAEQQNSADIFDPATNTFTPANSSLHIARGQAIGVTLADHRIFIVGGVDNQGLFSGNFLSGGEIYDGSFTVTGGLNALRVAHAAVRLLNGKVLVAGGADGALKPINSAELFSPGTGRFEPTNNTMNHTRVSLNAV